MNKDIQIVLAHFNMNIKKNSWLSLNIIFSEFYRASTVLSMTALVLTVTNMCKNDINISYIQIEL